MSIASEIERIQTAKGDIKTAIENKGVTVSSETKIDGYANLIDEIQTGGGSAVLINKTITANGEYNASSDSADGYKKVIANVPNTYSASDEGKVVSSGALVAQTSDTVTQNNTYDTTLINSLTVAVPAPPGYTYGTFTPATLTGSITIDTGLSTLHGLLIIPAENLTYTNSTQKLFCLWMEIPATYIKMFVARRNNTTRNYELWISSDPPITITGGVVDISFNAPANTGYFDTHTYKWIAW